MEKCFHIHCVRSVYSEYKYGENRVEIDPGTVRSEKRESWYLEIIDLNMVTITPLSSPSDPEHTYHLSLISTMIDWKELIRMMWTEILIMTSCQLRGCSEERRQELRAEPVLAILQFCAKFCANCHSANFSAAVGLGQGWLAGAEGEERLW